MRRLRPLRRRLRGNLSRVDELLAEWREGAAERRRLMREAGNHGLQSQARERLLARDSKLGRRLLDVGNELREHGIDPMTL